MIPEQLNPEERSLLLKLARQALESGVCKQPVSPLDLQELPGVLREIGATFVTLTQDGELRGCIGALDACRPLAEDVQEHAIAAALHDYRFPHVSPEELERIKIEVSRLTPPKRLEYSHPEELPRHLHPNVDGVVLKEGFRRSTFLPQVWEKIPDPEVFLSYLCQKMGASPNLWRQKVIEVWTYQVEEFHE